MDDKVKATKMLKRFSNEFVKGPFLGDIALNDGNTERFYYG